MDDLDKLEELVARTGVKYKQAVRALKEAEGELERAIADIKQSRRGYRQRTKEEFEVRGEELKEKVEDLIEQSNVTRLRIRRGNKILLDLPVAAGIIGTAISPYLAAVGALAAVLTKCSIEVERSEEETTPSFSPIDNPEKV